jgi:hypothetical protein
VCLVPDDRQVTLYDCYVVASDTDTNMVLLLMVLSFCHNR